MSALQSDGSQLLLVRHAPVAEPGILCGRTDLPARIEAAAIAPLAAHLSGIAEVVSSPAQRCRQTARALWPERAEFEVDARLWEQDFGAHEGLRSRDLPELGPMTGEELALYRPPEGESFDDLCNRVLPALADWAARAQDRRGPVALVVHAGVIRAALAHVLGDRPAALCFEIAPLSLTRLRVGAQGPFAVIETNRTWA